ncbi:MAG: hypothetical protein ACJ74Y_14830 [Bryobacteraceae bacterium]
MHLKDFSGGEQYLGYCPLEKGKVNMPAILDMMDEKEIEGYIMVGIDSPAPQRVREMEKLKNRKAYLRKLGVEFRAWLETLRIVCRSRFLAASGEDVTESWTGTVIERQ